MSSILSGEQLVSIQAKTNYELPSSGVKEFEPNKSWLEEKQIQSALDERKVLLEEERVEKWNHLMEAKWIPDRHKAEVKRKNKHWEVFGHHSNGKDWLFPEEVLFLMEMNCLECHFEEVPLSIQKGYTVLLRPESSCSINEYRVFSHLCRAGYRVLRHLPDLTVSAYERQIRLDQHLVHKQTYGDMVFAEQDFARPDLPPKQILDLSNNVEVLIKTVDVPLIAEEIFLEEVQLTPEIHDQLVKPPIEVIYLEDSSEESSDDSDIEIIEVIPNKQKDQTIVKTENYIQFDTCDIINDIEIIEVPVVKKEIEVTTIESSDSEQEENCNESDSDKSCDGNWKRRRHNKKKSLYMRPALMDRFNFLAAEEFCGETSEKSKDNINNKFSGNEKSASLDCVVPQRPRFKFSELKSRTDILDMMPSMARQKIMTVERPDLRLIPDTICPKQHTYIYNTNSFKARLFTFRPGYRGRRNFHGSMINNYNPYNNNTYNQTANRPHLLNSTLTQMFGSDVQSVARGMIQFASSLLNNSLLPNQTNGTFPPNFQPDQVSNRPPYIPSGFNSQTMRDEHSYPTPTHIRFSDSPVSLIENVRQPFQNRFGSRIDIYRSSEYEDFNRRIFSPQFRRYNERNRNRFSGSRPYSRNHLSHHTESFTPPNISNRAVDNNMPVLDPAYTRSDIPVFDQQDTHESKGDFIPHSVTNSNKNPIQIIDISDDDHSVSRVVSISNKFNKKRKLTKQMITNKFTKRRRPRTKKHSKNKQTTYVLIDSPKIASINSAGSVREEVTDLNITNINVKTELSENPTVQQENHQGTSDVDVKQENTEFSIKDEVDIKTESSNEVSVTEYLEQNNSLQTTELSVKDEIDNSIEIKTEPTNEVSVTEYLEQNNSLETTELSVKDDIDNSIEIKTEPTNEVTENLDKSNSLEDEKPNLQELNLQIYERLPSVPEEEQKISGKEAVVNMEFATDCPIFENEIQRDTSHAIPSTSTDIPNYNTTVINEKDSSELGNPCKSEPLENNDVVMADLEQSSSSKTRDISNALENDDSSKIATDGSTDGSDKVKSWAEIKMHNVPIGRTEEIQDEVETSSEEEGDDVQPLLRPKHCKSIDTVLSGLQIFSPFKPEVPDDVPKLKISFDMYLASDFRKAQRSLPHYRIVVLGGMDPIPSPAQFHELQSRFSDNVPLLSAIVMPNSVVFYNSSPISLPVDTKLHKE